MPYNAVIETPMPGAAARLGIRLADNRSVSAIDAVGDSQPLCEPDGAAAAAIAARLAGYLVDASAWSPVPTRAQGTHFQRRVWDALAEIPLGEVKTYGELAAELGSGPRAIGMACRTNPVPFFVPCHRIVAKQGMGGFMGSTGGPLLAIKQWLLRHENIIR